MSGKRKVPTSLYRKIRKLAAGETGRKAIAAKLGCSLYTVRAALDPEFVERERERQRKLGGERWQKRRDDPDYLDYQKARGATPERLEQVRKQMAALRAARRTPTTSRRRATQAVAPTDEVKRKTGAAGQD